MADDIGVNPTASYTVAADVIGTVGYQRVKVAVGADGTAVDVDITAPMPVQVSGYTTAVVAQASGTVTVNNGVSVTIQQGVSVTAAVTGNVTVAGQVTVATQLGTQVVSVVPGVSVNVGGLANVVVTTAEPAVNASGIAVWNMGLMETTAAPDAGATGQVVWVAGSVVQAAGASVVAQVSGAVTVATQLGTQVVSVVPGVSVNVGGLATALVTTTAVTTGTAMAVWIMNPTQAAAVSVSINATMAYKTPVIVRVAVNAAVVPDTKIAFSVFANGTNVVGTTSWVVPAGKTFEIVGGAIYAKTSAVISFAALAIAAETATASVSVTSTMNLAFVMPYGITAATAGFSVVGAQQDIAAGTSIGMLVLGGTTHSHIGGAIYGYLF